MNKNFYASAEEEIKRRREINAEKLNLRRREVETAVPEYKVLSREIAKTGKKLLNIILSGEDASKQLEKLERDSISAQEMIKSLLVQNKYSSDYLDEIYSCKKCRDTGVYQERRCSCFKEIVKKLASRELNASAPIKLSNFESFDINFYPDRTDTDTGVQIRGKMARNFTFCKDYAENFRLPCEGILMQGNTGLGKTHLSLAIAKSVIEKGFSVIYGSAPDFFRKLDKERYKNDGESDTAGRLAEADLLVFDDLGAEAENQYYTADFTNILNSRIIAGLPTIVNTNLELPQLKKRYGDRVVSRLLTMEYLVFVGEDIRVAKKYGLSI